MSGDITKAIVYAQKQLHGGCILQLEVDIGYCLDLNQSNMELRHTWQAAGYDSVHAAEGVLHNGPHVG